MYWRCAFGVYLNKNCKTASDLDVSTSEQYFVNVLIDRQVAALHISVKAMLLKEAVEVAGA